MLVTRSVTERPEGVDAGAVRIVGTDAATISRAVIGLINDPSTLAEMTRASRGIYGDGHAAERIARILDRA